MVDEISKTNEKDIRLILMIEKEKEMKGKKQGKKFQTSR